MVCRAGMTQPAVWIVWLSGVAASHLQKSLSTTSIMRSLIGRRQAEAELLTVRQSDFQQKSAGIAIAQRRVPEHGVIPGLQRALGPTRASQHPRARDFEDPRARRLTILGIGLDDKGDVRVGPVHRLDGALHGSRMLEVVRRARMVRRRRTRKTQSQ